MHQLYCCFRKHRYTVFSRIVAFPSIYLFICFSFIYLFIFKKRGFYLLFFHLNHDFYLRAASVRENTVFFNVWIRRKLSKIVTCAEEFVPYCQIRVIKPHGKGLQLWRYSCCVWPILRTNNSLFCILFNLIYENFNVLRFRGSIYHSYDRS